MTNKNYISFVGFFDKLPNEQELENQLQQGLFADLPQKCIGGQDSLSIYLTDLGNGIGYLVADCPAGGWEDAAFVTLSNDGQPVKSEDNWNPNPVPQAI